MPPLGKKRLRNIANLGAYWIPAPKRRKGNLKHDKENIPVSFLTA
jgi:hypothetical protein